MNEEKIAITSSILIHLVLILILFFAVYIPRIEFKRIEILEFGYKDIANNKKYISPLTKSSSSGLLNDGTSSNIIPKKVDLPKVTSESDDPLNISKYETKAYNKLKLDDKIGSKSIKSDLSANVYSESNIAIKDKPVIGSSNDYLKSLSARLADGGEEESQYILEGDITTRVIVNQIIPKYPEGIQKTTSVKIKFEVLSDGSITNLLIVKKADPILEKISISALKQWKFNKLSEDIVQIGYITFIYQLK